MAERRIDRLENSSFGRRRKISPRERLLIAVFLIYWLGTATGLLLLSSFTSFFEAPINSPIEIRNALDEIAHLPYIHRVQEAMLENDFSEDEITAKTNFLSRSYLIMIAGYLTALSFVLLSLLLARVGKDPGTIILRNFGKLGLKWMAAMLSFAAAVNAVLIWISSHGLGDLTDLNLPRQIDYIVKTNFGIILNLSILSISLLISLIIIRATLSCIFILFNRHD